MAIVKTFKAQKFDCPKVKKIEKKSNSLKM